MKAILLKAFGGPEEMYIGECPQPTIGADEVLVKVKATALNRADILQRKGNYPPPPGATEIMGLEMAGEVIALGKRVQRWQIGQRVCGLLAGGGYAQFVRIHEELLMPVPEQMSFEQAAAIPEVFLTAYQALALLAQIKPGEKVLIHAGASGVGTAAIQLVKHLGGEALVTASKPKHELCVSLGADFAVDYKTENFENRIKEKTDGLGVDIIIDFIGAPYFEANINLLKSDGRLVILAFMGGAKVNHLNLAKVLLKRVKIIGSTLRGRTLAYKIGLNRSFVDHCWEHFNTRKLQPVIDSIFPWEKVIEAHRRMESNQNKGKIVLTVN